MPRLPFVMAGVLVMMLAAADADEIYNQVGVVKGQVFIVNNPELGRTAASGQYFIFQRTDCRRCLVGIRTDAKGKYSAFLGVGRYRVICIDPEREGADHHLRARRVLCGHGSGRSEPPAILLD